MYQLQKNLMLNKVCAVNKTTDNGMISIPIYVGNTDYANFKEQVLAGAELQDADGNTMTAEEAKTYVRGLP
jgi:hypothetical protein